MSSDPTIASTEQASQFRKKPVVIEAVQFDGSLNAFDAVRAFGCEAAKRLDTAALALLADADEATIGAARNTVTALVIPTLEGEHIASPGDWIIRGVNGEFYPCKPDIFAATYASTEQEEERPSRDNDAILAALDEGRIPTEQCAALLRTAAYALRQARDGRRLVRFPATDFDALHALAAEAYLARLASKSASSGSEPLPSGAGSVTLPPARKRTFVGAVDYALDELRVQHGESETNGMADLRYLREWLAKIPTPTLGVRPEPETAVPATCLKCGAKPEHYEAYYRDAERFASAICSVDKQAAEFVERVTRQMAQTADILGASRRALYAARESLPPAQYWTLYAELHPSVKDWALQQIAAPVSASSENGVSDNLRATFTEAPDGRANDTRLGERDRVAGLPGATPLQAAGGHFDTDLGSADRLASRAESDRVAGSSSESGEPSDALPRSGSVRVFHDAAMRAADDMLKARAEGDEGLARIYAEHAFDDEVQALRQAVRSDASPATLAILHKSLTALGAEMIGQPLARAARSGGRP